jgi:hypothetical protein
LKTIAAVYPKGQEMLKKPAKMKTNGSRTAVVEFWKGAVDAGGQTVSVAHGDDGDKARMDTYAGLYTRFIGGTTGRRFSQDNSVSKIKYPTGRRQVTSRLMRFMT